MFIVQQGLTAALLQLVCAQVWSYSPPSRSPNSHTSTTPAWAICRTYPTHLQMIQRSQMDPVCQRGQLLYSHCTLQCTTMPKVGISSVIKTPALPSPTSRKHDGETLSLIASFPFFPDNEEKTFSYRLVILLKGAGKNICIITSCM